MGMETGRLRNYKQVPGGRVRERMDRESQEGRTLHMGDDEKIPRP